MNRFLPVILVVLLAAQTGIAPATMILQSYSPQKHDRFHDPSDPNKAFIGDPYDWSGVGRNWRWATLISPSYFVTAEHYKQGNGTTLYFYTTNDPAETPEQRVIQSGQRIAGSDLWLGKLTTPVSTHVQFYPILGLPEHSDYDDLEIYTFGLSVDRFSATATTVRLGRNNIDPDSIAPRTEGEPPNAVTGQTFLFDFDNPGGVGDDESYLQAGDSGGPSFVIHDGAPALVGVHWFIWEDENQPEIVGSGDTFVPEYIADLNAAMVGEQVTVVSSILTWNGLGDGNWDSDTQWNGGPSGTAPDRTNPAVVHTNQVTVAESGDAYSLLIRDGGRLVVRADNPLTLAVVRNVEIVDGTLELAPTGTLDIGGQLTMQADSQYVCQLDGPQNGLLAATGDVYLGGTLGLQALDKLRQVPPGELQWYGDETRSILDAVGSQIVGTFDHVPLTVPENPGPANYGQGHLGRGVFLTGSGPNGQGVTYGAHAVQVDLFQAADGDINGDRYLNSKDIQAILAANTFGNDHPADWPTGDFDGNGLCNSDDIQAILATALWDPYHNDPYAAAKPGQEPDGVANLVLEPATGNLTLVSDGVFVSGYLIKSAQGVLTGQPADNLGWFTEDTDLQISGGFGFLLDGAHRLGDVIGREFAAVDLREDLTFTYTLEGTAGIYHGKLVVPEPGTLAMLAGAALALLLVVRRRRA